MRSDAALYAIAAALAAVGALTVLRPDLMLSPGELVEGHRGPGRGCLACHVLGRGVPSEKCVACHKIEDIGVLTTAGAPVRAKAVSGGFHLRMRARDCTQCHGDHRGGAAFRAGYRFDHSALAEADRGRCEECHRKPSDALHRGIDAGCAKCHSQERWLPAAFEHERFFVLDRAHAVECVTCHSDRDFERYTCYGCHAHDPARVRAQHAERPPADLDRCASCHRSASEHESGEGRGERAVEREDDD